MHDRSNILRRSAPPLLRGLVSEITVYRESGGLPVRMHEVAALVVPLIFGFGDPFAIALGRAPRAGEDYASFAAGLTDSQVEILSPGGAHCLQINFTPAGARAFFGLPMSELTGVMVDPAALLGPAFERMRQRLGNEGDWNRRVDCVEAWIAARLADRMPAPAPELLAYRRLVANGGRVSIGALAQSVDLSRKHLSTLFRDRFGLPPKTIARIVRFQAALGEARGEAAPDWAAIAAGAGYADQAHLVREFRALAGRTPGQLLAA